MKVLIAANGPEFDSEVAKRFGHAPYYLCVDTATMQVEAIDNREHHDETHTIIPKMVGQGVELFITGNIGPNAFQLAQSLNRPVALARKMLASEALDKLQRNELELLSGPTLKHSVHDQAHH